ncbi:MAG: ribosome maturation factor RimM [Bdellovibrionaceae bacterium]|nr:ribosome maturation factor RimM [Pseudobdellovibrionaceae bacterium]
MKEFVTVGRVKDGHGLKGELFITLFAGEAAWLPKLKELRLIPPGDLEGPAKTFPVRHARLHKNGLIVLSPDIRGRNEAESLKGWMLEIPGEFLVSEAGEQIYLAEIENFKVDVEGRGEIGRITGFSSNGIQDLLVVATDKGEFEIPFVDAFVQEIDYENETIRMSLPIGLLGEEQDGEPNDGLLNRSASPSN